MIKRSTSLLALACLLTGMPIGSIIGYVSNGGYVEEFPTIAAYSFLSPIFLVSPAGYSGEYWVFSLSGLLLAVGSLLAFLRSMPRCGMVFAFGAALTIGVGFGKIFYDALSA